MARQLYSRRLVADCEVTLFEVGNPRAGPGYLKDPLPKSPPTVEVGPGGIAITTRCPDDGEVALEVWAGDPGPPDAEWETLFDGRLTTAGRGFDAGTATASVFHLNAPPGTYRVRAEGHRDARRLVDAVRLVFPQTDRLEGVAVP